MSEFFTLIIGVIFSACMVPVVMAIILGLIYGLGELFNIISHIGRSDLSHVENEWSNH
ncbi:MAG: AcrZ family multidrug efflux pump-associated protein [Enterobacteriaceae bacterium]|jgi:hypothetical protein|nr:AcrZ family multidrug efflux pump-associated protein [Enterobacteriaceae bacterium]